MSKRIAGFLLLALVLTFSLVIPATAAPSSQTDVAKITQLDRTRFLAELPEFPSHGFLVQGLSSREQVASLPWAELTRSAQTQIRQVQATPAMAMRIYDGKMAVQGWGTVSVMVAFLHGDSFKLVCPSYEVLDPNHPCAG